MQGSLGGPPTCAVGLQQGPLGPNCEAQPRQRGPCRPVARPQPTASRAGRFMPRGAAPGAPSCARGWSPSGRAPRPADGRPLSVIGRSLAGLTATFERGVMPQSDDGPRPSTPSGRHDWTRPVCETWVLCFVFCDSCPHRVVSVCARERSRAWQDGKTGSTGCGWFSVQPHSTLAPH
jgi:hypothetical protein